MNNHQYGWGLIGASTIASQWVLGAINAQPGNRCVGVFSSQPQRGQEYAAQHNLAKRYATLDELLADSDIHAVYISTTNELHKEQCLAAAAAGKHVLCEKPLALSVADALTMVRACDEAGVVMATNHHIRNAASHLKIKEVVSDGAIGDVLAARVFHAVYLPEHLQGWRLDRPDAGGGVILDIVVHDADTLRFHLDEDPDEVVGFDQNAGMGKKGLEDGSMAVIRFPSGAIAQTHESFVVRYAGSGFELHGTRGSIKAKNVMTQQPTGEIRLTTTKGESVIDYKPHNLYERALRLFVGAMRGEDRPAADGLDGVKSLAVALALKQSCQEGRAIKVQYS